MTTTGPDGAGSAPSSATAAVLKPSVQMPQGSQKVEEFDFDKFAGRSITVEDLISGMNHMGFQASSIGEAVRIINDMVWSLISSQSPIYIFWNTKTAAESLAGP